MFVSGVNNTGNCLAVSMTPTKNLLAVSLTPAINFRLFGYLWPVSTTRGKIIGRIYRRKIYHRWHCHQWSLFTGVVDTGNKFIVSAVVTINVHRCHWYRRKIYHRCHCHWRSFLSGVNDIGDKFIASINDTVDQRKSVTKINRRYQRHCR